MARSLLIITQKIDEADDLLGFFVAWVAEFAQHFDQVHVIALGVGTYEFSKHVHVHSLGKERGISKFRQAIQMVRLLWRLTPECDAVFAHMSPLFAIIAWPFSMLFRKKLALWYLHRSVTLRLRLALMMCDQIFTADTKSLGVHDEKVIQVGHGIDAKRWATDRAWNMIASRPLHIISVGRLSPIKNLETLIRAVAQMNDKGKAVQIRIIGRPVMPKDAKYADRLRDLVRELLLEDVVQFVGFVPYLDMPTQYSWADIAIGCTPAGGIDKALLEAMAAGCVVMTSNDAMGQYLVPYADRLLFGYGDPTGLANSLGALHDMEAISVAMVASVRARHDLSATIAKISAFL